jgi:hypothetical protein
LLRCSGSRFFLIAAQGIDLMAKQLGTLLITAGECNGKGELQFFQLMLTFRCAAGGSWGAVRMGGAGGCGRAGSGASRRGESHG